MVDDGSEDKTAEIARLAGALVIEHESNMGKGAAIKTAFERAKILDMDILVLLDADGQHNPDEIPDLVKPILENKADIVIGSRFMGDGYDIPLYRRFGQEVLTKATNMTSNVNVTDSQSGFRAFSKNALDLNLSESGFSIESEIIVDATRKGLKIKEVPISCRYDVEGSTLNPIVHGFGVLGRILLMISGERPLFLFWIVGFTMTCVGLLLGTWAIRTSNITNGFDTTGVIAPILLMVAGVTSMFSGLISNFLR